MTNNDDSKSESDAESTPPVDIEVVIDGRPQRLRYDKAFVLACALLEKGQLDEASKLFERLEDFVDRGPRAFIMQAFCEAASLHLEKCSESLAEAFEGEDRSIADALQSAFVSFHVGIRQDALKTMTDLVNAHHELPTLCLLLGNMLKKDHKIPLAKKCWKMAIQRDRTGGAVAAAATRQLKKYSADAAGK